MTARILSYNVRYFAHATRGLVSTQRSLERVATAVAAVAPQIICLQEVEARSLRSGLGWRRSPSQHAAFADALRSAGAPRYEGRYFPAHVSGLAAWPLYSTGLSVFVDDSFTIEASDVVALTEERRRGERRICAHVVLRDRQGGLVHLYNTHLSLPTRPLRTRLGDGDNQLTQATRLAQEIRARSGDAPFILCGDFNAEPDSAVIDRLCDAEGLRLAPNALAPTAGFGPIRKRLDYLLAGEGIEWIDGEGTNAFGDRDGAFHDLSDHVPLIARFSARASSRPSSGASPAT